MSTPSKAKQLQRARLEFFQHVMYKLGWTQARMAEELEMSERNINRYMTEALPVSKVVSLALQHILRSYG